VTAILFRREDGAACERATRLWIAHVKSTSDTLVLRNAVSFFRCTRQPLLALDAITKAQAIEPSNAAWKEELAQVYLAIRHAKPAELHRELASRILKELEEVCINEPMRERSLLPTRALVAHEAGDLDQARRLGQRLLDFVPHNSRIFPVYWQTRYYGHLILGRVSLAEGDLEAAKNHLAHSLEPPFEAHLKSFLPNMTLAKELLERGAKDAVVQFLTLCAQHCPSRVHGQYWTWVNQIQKGEAPDFFGHLHNWS